MSVSSVIVSLFDRSLCRTFRFDKIWWCTTCSESRFADMSCLVAALSSDWCLVELEKSGAPRPVQEPPPLLTLLRCPTER